MFNKARGSKNPLKRILALLMVLMFTTSSMPVFGIGAWDDQLDNSNNIYFATSGEYGVSEFNNETNDGEGYVADELSYDYGYDNGYNDENGEADYGYETDYDYKDEDEYEYESKEYGYEEKETVATTVTIIFDEDTLFVQQGSSFNLLEGVSAVDQDGESVNVFVLDSGGFDINAEWPYNRFTITYAAIHPVSEEYFTAQRTAFVTMGFVPLSAVPVSTWAQLETEIQNAVGSIEILVENNLTATGGPIVIPTGLEVTLLASNDWTITNTGSLATAFIVNGTLNLGATNPASGQDGILAISSFTQNGIQVVGGTLNMHYGIISHNGFVSLDGGNVYVNNGGMFRMFNGEIRLGLAVIGGGGGVFVANGSTFEMFGGEISSNMTTGDGGSGVYIVNNSTFEMFGGEISGNTVAGNSGGSNDRGGSIRVANNSTFEMSGGEISGNTNQDSGGRGGGVAVVNNSTFEMSGGEISGNITSGNTHGGGVYINDSRFEMSGNGIISGHETARGGGVHVVNSSTFKMFGNSEISDNVAFGGGGVFVDNSVFEMSGNSKISDNVTNGAGLITNGGGGVHVANSSTFEMFGNSEISNNDSHENGGGVSVENSKFTMYNGSIVGNTANSVIMFNGLGGGVYVANSSTFEMRNGTISENSGTRGGGVYMYDSTFTMEDSVISNNTALVHWWSSGGGVFVWGGTFEMSGSEISGNQAIDSGGGVFVWNGMFEISDSEISDNTTDANGGGVAINNNGILEMSDSIISGNTAESSGGGVIIGSSSTFEMSGSEISDNEAYWGGGVSVDNNSTFEMFNSEISDNVATGGGGGVYVAHSAFEMHNSTIDGNYAGYGGGGVHVHWSTFETSDSEIKDNIATGGGGGVHAHWSTFEMHSGIVSDNDAGNLGGGVYVHHSEFKMHSGTISDNEACGGGGGAYVHWSTFEMLNGTISDNRTGVYGNGGGVHLHWSMFEMLSGTISDNVAGVYQDGGGVYVSWSTFEMLNGTIHNNEAGAHGGGVFVGPIGDFTMETGTISNNQAGVHGGGIHILDCSVLEIQSGSIINNTANYEGGGIYTRDFVAYNALTLYCYQNLTIGSAVIFSGNSAYQAYSPPAIAASYTNIEYASTSIFSGGGYIHPINNFDINFVGNEPLNFFWVQYYANGGVGSHRDNNILGGTNYTIRTLATTGISRAGNNFIGWNTAANGSGTAFAPGDVITAINANVTLYAQWQPVAERTYHQVEYRANGGIGSHLDGNILGGTQYTIHTLAATGISRTGYNFTGWNTAANGSGTAFAPGAVITINANVVLYAQWQRGGNGGNGGNGGETTIPNPPVPLDRFFVDEHIWFIRGYEDGTIRPNNQMTRAEVAMAFFRLLRPEMQNVASTSPFTDVQGDEWYGLGASVLAHHGIFEGFEDGSFRPNRPITRREFVAVTSRFDQIIATNANPFLDVSAGDWARTYILSAAERGWFVGFEGEFRPGDNLTRAELVTVINRMLNRSISLEDLPANIERFSDLTESHWAFAAFKEAIHTHDYERLEDGVNEKWTVITGHGRNAAYNR